MVKLAVVAAVVAVVVVVGCQGQGRSGGNAGSDSGTRPGSGGFGHREAPVPVPVRDAELDDGESDDIGSARPKPDEPEQVEMGKSIDELGAIPAWQAVVDRSQYLARRGQHGVVFGVIGPEIDTTPYVWLVDDTEGHGALAIRVALGSKHASAGDRVGLGGAWALDDARRWFWKVDAMSALPAAPPPANPLKEPPAAPGHVIANGDFPAGVHKISLGKEGDAVYFQVVGAPPAIDGDGWPVADELGNPVYALLNLPGERASYGAQDLRMPDERWQLKRGVTYWVRIGPPHKHGSDKPATINARTAPIKVM